MANEIPDRILDMLKGQPTVYQFEIYNTIIDEIFQKYCDFSLEQIEKSPKGCAGKMAIGIEWLKNWLTDEDRMPPDSPYQWERVEDIHLVPEEDYVGIPDQTFNYRDRILRKAEIQLAELLEIYRIPKPRHLKQTTSGTRSRGRWKDRDKDKDIVRAFAQVQLEKNPEIRIGRIVKIIQEEELVCKLNLKLYADDTIRGWLSPDLPDHNKKPGRPKKSGITVE